MSRFSQKNVNYFSTENKRSLDSLINFITFFGYLFFTLVVVDKFFEAAS